MCIWMYILVHNVKFNSYCGLWPKKVCETVFHNTGKYTITEIYLGNLLKTGGRKKKILGKKKRKMERL